MEDSYVLQLLEPKFKEFHLCFCGFAQCEPLHSYGPASRPNYIIHYIMDGKGIYQVGEKKYKLSKGQGFLIEPEELTFYQADQEEPWSYLWVGVGGTGAKKFIQDIGLNSQQRIFRCADGEKLNEIVMDMMKHTRSTVSDLYYLQGRLYDFFAVLARDVVIDSYADTLKEKEYGKHPTQKPLYLLDRIILASSNEGDVILDPFCGSGTTGLSAKQNGRMFIGIDNNKPYLELAKKRISRIL